MRVRVDVRKDAMRGRSVFMIGLVCVGLVVATGEMSSPVRRCFFIEVSGQLVITSRIDADWTRRDCDKVGCHHQKDRSSCVGAIHQPDLEKRWTPMNQLLKNSDSSVSSLTEGVPKVDLTKRQFIGEL